MNENPKKENRNGILAAFRKDVIKKSNLIEKEIKAIKVPKNEMKEKLNSTRTKRSLLDPELIQENSHNSNLDNFMNDNQTSSQKLSDSSNNTLNIAILSKTQSKKKQFFATEALNENENAISTKYQEKSNAFSKNVSSFNGDLRSTREIPHMRLRRLKIKGNSKWYIQNKLPTMNIVKEMAYDSEYQSNLINDEIIVLFSDIQKFRIKLLDDPNILSAFKSQNTIFQTKFNQTIEESYLLMMEIINFLIEDFAKFLEKISNIHRPKLLSSINATVTNESEALVENSKIFTEVYEYFLSCYEVYTILIKQVDNMRISYKDFIVVLQYFGRCRMNISELTYSCENFVNNYFKDRDLVSKYISRTYAKKNDLKKSKFLDIHKVDVYKKKMKDLNNLLNT